MPALRMPRASVLIATCAALAAPVHAAPGEALDEQRAIALALAREGIAARDTADRAAAEADAQTVGPLENPNIQIARESGGETEWQIGIVQPLDLGGERFALRDAARAEAEATDADIDRRRQQLVADVRGAFVRCAAGRAGAETWQSYTTALGEALRVAALRAEAGDTAGYDVRRVRVASSAAEAGLLRARGEADADCAILAALTGIADPQVPIDAVTALDAGPTEGERADLLAREQRIAAADYRVSAARRVRLPQVSVGAGVRIIEDALGSTSTGPTVSLGVSVPLWNGGGAAVRRESARRDALAADLAIARRTIEAEQAAARIHATAAREAALAAIRTREDAARLGTIADTAYRAGEVGVVELLDAHEAAREADLSVIALALEAALAAVDYDLATGRNY
jgi:outer membrane protein, heavy metal efflux system